MNLYLTLLIVGSIYSLKLLIEILIMPSSSFMEICKSHTWEYNNEVLSCKICHKTTRDILND